MLQRCKDAHLVLNWEKYHFMVKEGIVLGHKVSSAGLEVDKAKINVISKLPPPTNIKGVRSFLRHVDFYRRFIKDFSKISRPLTKLLEKDTPFEFNDECQKAFELLKEKLTCAPVIISPNWNLPFELMCDASDFAVGAVLEPYTEPDIDPDVQADVDACIAFVDDIATRGTDVRVEMETTAEEEAESSTRGMIKIGVDRITHLVISYDILEPVREDFPELVIADGSLEVMQRGLDVIMQELYDHMVEILVHRVRVIESV
ncbi:reverse transcriptase domain-containing protein [Tanacetum coccineum]